MTKNFRELRGGALGVRVVIDASCVTSPTRPDAHSSLNDPLPAIGYSGMTFWGGDVAESRRLIAREAFFKKTRKVRGNLGITPTRHFS
jgi:hypothetical protein